MLTKTLNSRIKKTNPKISIFDVTNYIIQNTPHPITNMKLQKMVYYVYAKHLVEKQNPIFTNEKIEAWLHGAVFPQLYNEFKHNTWQPITKTTPKGNTENLTKESRKIIDTIIQKYGDKTGDELSTLNHQEKPWQISWDNNDDWSKNVISDETILKYFKNKLQKIN
ncbi:Panacea domain-containing protein [Candidatus Phytoplasma pruni]|uniref:DUF4065 domain-containing protein n=1 Tax=Candidatus Phytoplasma pruni TaxID=479893 RepID=A0A851HC06_9MOLU|nr:type II toxin-antitoxin system antitoxin SocA domain-containing protein [Candidatus Phytoplasma pruni]NWN45561.1 DUF4065 domain-containing protein [Candidatus Phytoplasma pruni]